MISQQEYAARRETFKQLIGPQGVAIIPAALEQFRNGETHYGFRQDSNFHYLTGFPEPEAITVIAPGRKEGEYILFNRRRDPAMETWTGPRAGQEGAMKEYGADQAFAIDEFQEQLGSLLADREAVYYPITPGTALREQLTAVFEELRCNPRSGVGVPETFINLNSITMPMRRKKSEAELAIIRKATAISAAAHKRVMGLMKPGLWENEIEAEYMYDFLKAGCKAAAYGSIVGSGKNATVLHYEANNCQIQDGDLVLIDAGGEYQCYASDITRTIPANGKYSPEQKAVYEAVLKAQELVLAAVKPGVTFAGIHQLSCEAITQGLMDIGLLSGDHAELVKAGAYKKFYMHYISHFMGLDVHDDAAGSYKRNGRWIPFEAGFVLTVEPGIYIPPNTEGVDEKWWNIGVRIEDDVLVTEAGCEVLTSGVPKTVAEIEAIMAGRDA